MNATSRTWLRSALGAACVVSSVTSARAAPADQREETRTTTADEPGRAATPPNPVADAARSGSFVPLTLPASVTREHVYAMAYGGYDTAARNARFVSFAEARVYGPLALRLGAQSSAGSDEIAPSVAARLQVLSEATQGIDTTVSLAYNAEGFTEFEGELELVIAVGRSFGNWQLVGNVAYGQDPEGEERDGEFRTALLYHVGTHYYLGLDGRGRADLGSDRDKLREHNEPLYDVDVGPVANLAFGPVVFGVHGGLSAVEHVDENTRFGGVVLAGLGTAL